MRWQLWLKQSAQAVCLLLLLSLSVPSMAGPGPRHRPTVTPPRTIRRSQFVRGPLIQRIRAERLSRLPGSPFLPIGIPRKPNFGQSDPSSVALLKQMLQAGNTLALSGNQTLTVIQHGRRLTSEIFVIHNGSHASHVEYRRPASLAGEIIVDNGRMHWHYIPSTKTLEISPARRQQRRMRPAEVMNAVRRGAIVVSTVGNETVAGHPCRILQVSASQVSAPWRRFWVDPTNGAQLKTEEYDNSGNLSQVSFYTSLTYNPPIDNRDFQAPHVPSSVRIVAPETGTLLSSLDQAQTQAGFTLLRPAYLPPGFHFKAAEIEDYQGNKLADLHFNNGLNVISLFETPARGLIQNNRVEKPRQGMQQAWQNGLHIVLVGSLSPDEMNKIITALH